MKFIVTLVILLSSFAVFAQTKADTLTVAGIADAKKLTLNDAQFSQFKKDRKNSTSDFFKPNRATTADTLLLNDSAYVKSFRAEAYKRYAKKRTAGHRILMGYIWVNAVIGAAFIVVLGVGLLIGKPIR